MSRAEPPVPAILMARCFMGGDYTLAIIRTVQHNEGSAILERAGDAGGVDFVQYLTWTITHSDGGPAAIQLDEPEDSGDVVDLPGALNRLLEEIVKTAGGRWGIEGWVEL